MLSEAGAGASPGARAAPGGLDQLRATRAQGDAEREQRKSMLVLFKCARGTREDTVQGCSDQGKLSSTWAPHVRHKYSSLVSAQLGRALFSFRKECCQFVFG